MIIINGVFWSATIVSKKFQGNFYLRLLIFTSGGCSLYLTFESLVNNSMIQDWIAQNVIV